MEEKKTSKPNCSGEEKILLLEEYIKIKAHTKNYIWYTNNGKHKTEWGRTLHFI